MTLKVAVVGAGAMGRNHARVLADLPQADLVGVCDSDAHIAKSVARRHGSRAFADYRKMLDDLEPAAVVLAVPTVEHLNVGRDIIERGIHILIEKPIASNVSDGGEIIAAAERSGVHLMIGHIERFNPAIVALKAHLDHGEMGRVFQIDAQRQGPYPARVQDIGVAIDLAVHDLDIMRYISGAEIKRVYAEVDQRINSAHEDQLTALLRLDNSIVGTLNINWLTPTKIRKLRVIGERGMFQADYITQDLYFFENATAENEKWDTLKILRGVSEGKMIRYVVTKKEPLRLELEHFLRAVEDGKPMLMNALDGLRALELAEALIASSKEHRAISC